jgi:hypothetical protein
MGLPLQILPSASRSATTTVTLQNDNSSRGVQLIVNVTSIQGGTPSVVPHIQVFDPGSATFVDVLIGAAITAVGTYFFRIHPLLGPVPNLVAQDILPYKWAVQMVHADGQAITYSIGANMLD